jgi:hypothetical protein
MYHNQDAENELCTYVPNMYLHSAINYIYGIKLELNKLKGDRREVSF